MDKVTGVFRVFFEEPFWAGVFERYTDGKLSVCKVVFGAEPKDGELYEFIMKNYYRLRFSPSVEADKIKTCKNPKRLKREVQKQLVNKGIGTKSQQALKLQYERTKIERTAFGRAVKDAQKQHRLEMKQQKRRNKHRGR